MLISDRFVLFFCFWDFTGPGGAGPCGAGSGGSGPGGSGPSVGDQLGHGASSKSGGAAQVSRLSGRLQRTTDVTVWTLLLQV